MSSLAFVSLFALVVSSRPILPDGELNVRASPELQGAVQAAFQIDAGNDAARVPSLVEGEQNQLFQTDNPMGASTVRFSHKADPSLKLVSDDSPSRGYITSELGITASAQSSSHASYGTPPDIDAPSTPDNGRLHRTVSFLVVVFSCVAAFLALACIVLVLYITKCLVSCVLTSQKVWEVLPRVCQRAACFPQSETALFAYGKGSVGNIFLLQPSAPVQNRPVLGSDGVLEKCGMHVDEKLANCDTTPDVDSDHDDVEDYQDALDMTPPMPTLRDLLPEESGALEDPPFPEIREAGTAPPRLQPSCNHLDGLMMNEISPTVTRPLWSVRASASPSFGLASSQTISEPAPQPLMHDRRRAYRSAVPELDIALALQLRPGFGLGADSAWMVRFLMTIFGWFAVALSGKSVMTDS
ncbi:hypothetical protein ID866_3376 [Astraeus odoratus]|nr:hypothetical protein ID866_3376 [Astraeus odoratus]